MTFDPVIPPVVLAVLTVAVLALRATTLVWAARSGRAGLLRWAALTGALVLVLVAAARPGIEAPAERAARDAGGAGENVFFLVDLSSDSAIDDAGGETRLSTIREDIDTLMTLHDGARFGLITFTSRPAVQWPLSGDAWSLHPLVDALTPASGPAAAADQANAAAAANVLRYQLIAARQRYPQAEELVYYFGSGAPKSTAPQSTFDGDAVDGGTVFGYGGSAGAATLRAVADQLGVPYVDRSAGDPVRVARIEPGAAATGDDEPAPRTEYYWLLTMLASGLLLVEIALTVRDLRRTRRGGR